MSQSEVTEAILNILKKEVGALEKLLPSDILKSIEAVSYTHLTLPTICSV